MAKHTFIISDESVNEYGFRVLTSGIDLTNFEKNPVMLYAHIRAYEDRSKDGVVLPIGKWENIRQQGSQLLADAVFDEEDEFAMKVAKKIDKGILNTASAGLKIIEESEDPALMLPGQTWPTITKSKLKEASIADIPGNGNAVKLYGESVTVTLGMSESNPQDLDKIFNKSSTKSDSNMKLLLAEINKHNELTGITLSDNATEQEMLVAFNKMVSKQTATLTEKDTEIAQLTADRDKFKETAEAAEGNALKNMAVALIDGAKASNKIVEKEAEHLLTLAQSSPEAYESVKQLIDGKKAYRSVKDQLNNETGDKSTKELAAEWDKLHAEDGLADLKLNDKEKYVQLFTAKYGKAPQAD